MAMGGQVSSTNGSKGPNVLQQAGMRALELARTFAIFLRDGITNQGNRDVYQVYGYPTAVSHYMMLAKYQRQGMATRIVDKPSDAIWTDPPTFKGASPHLTSVFKDLAQRLSLWQVLNRADRLAGMGYYSTIFMGMDDGQDPGQPLIPSKNNKILFMQPCSQETMRVSQFVVDPGDPRFGKPLYYAMNFANAGGFGVNFARTDNNTLFSKFTGSALRVHYSRVIHIVEGVLEDATYGNPRMLKSYNTLIDILKVGGGSAELYWLNARGGLHINVEDMDADLDEQDENDLVTETDDYINNQRRLIRTKGVKITPLNMTVADPRHSFGVLLDQLAAETGIPQRVLMGAEAGQLASDQDRANWAVFVNERRFFFAEPQVMRPFIGWLTWAGLLQISDWVNATLLWPEAFKLSPLERGQTSAQQARAVANLMKTFTAQAGTPATTNADGTTTPGTPGVDPLLTKEEARGIIRFGNEAPFGGEALDVDTGVA